MPDRVPYEYAVIRLVPKVEREEFLNIGVILYSKRKQYLDIKYLLDSKRIMAFSDDIDIYMIKKYLEAWVWVCQGIPEAGRIGQLEQASRFRWLVATRSTIIQSSQTHTGMSDDPAAVLNMLFERYVQV